MVFCLQSLCLLTYIKQKHYVLCAHSYHFVYRAKQNNGGIVVAFHFFFVLLHPNNMISMMKKIVLMLVSAILLCSCVKNGGSTSGAPTELKYAKCFTVTERQDGVRLVTVNDSEHDPDQASAYHFALVPKGQTAKDLPDGYKVVNVPIEHCIVMTLPQSSGFVELGALDRVSGMNSARTLKNAEVKARIRDGRIIQIGMEGNFDRELIIAAQPDVIFVSPSKRGGFRALNDADAVLVPYLGYKETTALGQAEWIKFVALFTGQEQQANDYFDALEARYNELKARVDSVAERPVVMNGRVLEGLWCAEGGQSVQAQLIRDAGARYILDDDTNTSDIKMEFEEMYAKAYAADYWTTISAQDNFTYAAMLDVDDRYADFAAFRNRHVVCCDLKASAFRELSPMHPDLLLSDFVYAFHPELMPADYRPTFYKPLP